MVIGAAAAPHGVLNVGSTARDIVIPCGGTGLWWAAAKGDRVSGEVGGLDYFRIRKAQGRGLATSPLAGEHSSAERSFGSSR
ncbi:hypothetical protein PG996_011131 [Apiospora saccharicola]|uniref:Uncharacterized protein n=1 Tax=Apiospora saccharicola TaxID=335842 RepID=A0ABR1UE74_9PEZI